VLRKFGEKRSAQKLVLDEFQRQRWKKEINFTSLLETMDIRGRAASEWLENTVHNLNQDLRRIRFHMDSKRRLISWGVVG
jgi:hypothetical protein